MNKKELKEELSAIIYHDERIRVLEEQRKSIEEDIRKHKSARQESENKINNSNLEVRFPFTGTIRGRSYIFNRENASVNYQSLLSFRTID